MRASDKVRVALATPQNSKKPLRFDQLTTSGFFQVQPIMYRDMIAKEHIKSSNATLFVRSNPLVTPAFTDISFNLHKFYCRYKDVWPGWVDYKQQVLHTFSSDSDVLVNPSYLTEKPYILEKDLVKLIILNSNNFVAVVNPDEEPYDICVNLTDNSKKYYKFVGQGIFVYKLLLSLGYRLNWNLLSEEKINILPIFAYGKCYLDWFASNIYYNSVAWMTTLNQAFALDSPNVRASATADDGGNCVYYLALAAIFAYCGMALYEDDDLYSAWDYPTAPTSNMASPIGVPDVTNDYPFVSTTTSANTLINGVAVDNWHNSNGTPSLSSSFSNSSTFDGNTSYIARLNQYMLDSLRKVTNMVRRAQMVGSRAVDRFLARYGVKLQDDHRSMLLGSQTIYLNIGDVESNADSSNGSVTSVVGDLAGKGVTLGNISYECNAGTNEGMFMILCVPRCTAGLVQGMDKHNLNVNVYDDYTPEFDHLGTAAVPIRCVYAPENNIDVTNPDGVFGYLPRYWEYASNRSLMTGAFAMPSQGASELMSYHTFRLISGHDSGVVHSPSFLQPSIIDKALHNRIFYNLNAPEQLLISFKSTYVSNSPKRPLKDVYDFGDDDEKNGSIDMQSTGSKLN